MFTGPSSGRFQCVERARELAFGDFCFWLHREFWFSRYLMGSQQEADVEQQLDRAAKSDGVGRSRARLA